MKALNQWFLENKRVLPWREEPTPYRVWISEVMLQQTRAQVVVDYFERWMRRYPDVAALAGASIDEVIKSWEGLGYYSRARNLHAGARQLMGEWGGRIPDTREELLKIKGLGPYTVAAILAFGFRKRAAPVDGNVLRVMSRYLRLEEDIGKESVKRRVEEEVEKRLDEEAPWVTAEGLIELGAVVCGRKPRCDECPLRSECKAALQGVAELLPIKEKRERSERLVRMVGVVESEGAVLVRKNGAGGVMADLYEFPYVEGGMSPRMFRKEVELLIGAGVKMEGKLPVVKHSFTRFLVSLRPYSFRVEEKREVEGWVWVPIGSIQSLPFSSGHRKIMNHRCNFWRSCGFLKDYEYSSP